MRRTRRRARSAMRSRASHRGELRLVMSSPGLLAVESRARIQRDAQLASSLTLAGVILLLMATYRSAWPTLLSAVPALSGLAIGIVVVSVVFGPVHAITLGFGAMLIGEAIDYPTYLFANNAAGESLESTQARIGGTLTLAVATTACGALAMLLSGFRGLAQLGALILAGVIVAGLVTRYVLPALTPQRALSRKRATPPIDASRALGPLRQHAWIAVAAMALAVVVLFASRDALWDDDLANLNPLHATVKTLDRELREQTGAPDLRYLAVASGTDREAALAASERVARRTGAGGCERRARRLRLCRPLSAERSDATRAAGGIAGCGYVAAKPQAGARRPAVPRRCLRAVRRRRRADALRRAALARGSRRHGAWHSRSIACCCAHEGRWVALVPLIGVVDPAAVREALGEAMLLDLKGRGRRARRRLSRPIAALDADRARLHRRRRLRRRAVDSRNAAAPGPGAGGRVADRRHAGGRR